MSPSHSQAELLRGSVTVPSYRFKETSSTGYFSIDTGAKRERCWPTRLRKLDYQTSHEVRGEQGRIQGGSWGADDPPSA